MEHLDAAAGPFMSGLLNCYDHCTNMSCRALIPSGGCGQQPQTTQKTAKIILDRKLQSRNPRRKLGCTACIKVDHALRASETHIGHHSLTFRAPVASLRRGCRALLDVLDPGKARVVERQLSKSEDGEGGASTWFVAFGSSYFMSLQMHMMHLLSSHAPFTWHRVASRA